MYILEISKELRRDHQMIKKAVEICCGVGYHLVGKLIHDYLFTAG